MCDGDNLLIMFLGYQAVRRAYNQLRMMDAERAEELKARYNSWAKEKSAIHEAKEDEDK